MDYKLQQVDQEFTCCLGPKSLAPWWVALLEWFGTTSPFPVVARGNEGLCWDPLWSKCKNMLVVNIIGKGGKPRYSIVENEMQQWHSSSALWDLVYMALYYDNFTAPSVLDTRKVLKSHGAEGRKNSPMSRRVSRKNKSHWSINNSSTWYEVSACQKNKWTFAITPIHIGTLSLHLGKYQHRNQYIMGI